MTHTFDPELWIPGWEDQAPPPSPNGNGHHHEPTPSRNPDAPAVAVLPYLPDRFWNTRERLQLIRQAARHHQVGPDIVLLAILCRLSAMVSHKLNFDLGRGKGSLNLFGGAVGGTGLGKTLANNVAQDLLLRPRYLARGDQADPAKFRDGIGVGTGEGMIEAFMGVVEEETGEVHQRSTKFHKAGDPITERVRKQVRHNAYFFLDEGETLARLMERTGATIGPTIRSAWAGTSLGQQLADGERTRFVDRFTYSIGMVIGFQPETVQSLLADGAAGTPQRFLWASGYDLDLPDGDFDEVKPFRLPIEHFDGTPVTGLITGPEWLRVELRDQRRRLLRAEMVVEQLDSHATVMRCKLAALFALIDDRMRVDNDDWALAGLLWDTSCAIRDRLTEFGRMEAEKVARRKANAATELAVASHTQMRKLDADVERCARWLARRIHNGGPERERAPYRDMRSKDRKQYDLVLAHAVRMGWVTVDEGLISAGSAVPL